MRGLTSAAVREGSPWGCCVTGAPELELRTLDLSTRCSIRDTGLAAMNPAGRARFLWVAGFGSAPALGSQPSVLAVGAGGGGARAANPARALRRAAFWKL